MACSSDFSKGGLLYLGAMITGSVALLSSIFISLPHLTEDETLYDAVVEVGFWLAMTTIIATFVCGLLQFFRHKGHGKDWAVIVACAFPTVMALWAAISVLCLFRLPFPD